VLRRCVMALGGLRAALLWCACCVAWQVRHVHGLGFSDVRLKENVTPVDVAELLEAIERVQLMEFDFRYEQFYNKVFGKRQLGIIAQELTKVLPRAVGTVEKRAVGAPDDEAPTILENVHVFNSEHMFMANVGATQQLAKLTRELKQRMEKLGDDLVATSTEANKAKLAQEELSTLRVRQQELESLAKEAHERSEKSAQVAKSVESIEKDNQANRAERTELLVKIGTLEQTVQGHIKSQAELHRGIDAESAKVGAALESLKASLEAVSKQSQEESAAAKAAAASAELKASAVEADVDKRVSQVTMNTEKVVGELEKKVVDGMESIQADINRIDVELETLKAQVEKQAGEEIVEKRRIAEAEVEIEKARAELERVRGQEQRESARVAAELDEQRHVASLARVEEEEQVRSRRELATIQAQEEAALRQAKAKAEHDLELQRAAAEAELESIRSKTLLAQETAKATTEAEAKKERENHDLHLELKRQEAEQARLHTVETIKAFASEFSSLTAKAVSSPLEVLGAVVAAACLALAIYGVRESVALGRAYFERRMGQPSLVRETSRGKGGLSHMTPLRKLYASLWRLVKRCRALILPLSEEQRALLEKEAAESAQRENNFVYYMSDVVLPAAKSAQINRIARATRTAHQHKSPLRHVMFYGPPGTGKSMVCRHLAQWCGLEYAIMSGADVAPLKDKAVTEIHRLFKWANATSKGVLLFIDEADAFLASRDTGSVSESLRNALTALLYHTGSSSCKVMMVLATNRPGDLDRAIIDRMDESVQFDLPCVRERRMLLEQYYSTSVHPSVDISEVDASILDETATKLEGFSGREISKLMATVQAHVYGSESATAKSGAESSFQLSASLFRQVISNALEEHGKMQAMHHRKDYKGAF